MDSILLNKGHGVASQLPRDPVYSSVAAAEVSRIAPLPQTLKSQDHYSFPPHQTARICSINESTEKRDRNFDLTKFVVSEVPRDPPQNICKKCLQIK